SETPAVVWLAFGVHGDESSSAEAAMMVASRLMRDDAEVRAILERTVVIIDPLQNPDGRERYLTWFEGRVGREPDPEPEAMEHYQAWPGGRYNHYLVDMNRDWLWATQRESRARTAAYIDWKPQVFVDFHEMGYGTSYFFPPDADPINENIDPQTETWLEKFGLANAEAFSSRGWPFFVGEQFDLFYPGYGDSWPSLRGAIGMTYEMAGHGFAGRAVRREDGTVLTLADRAMKHYTTGMATLETAAANRRELLLHTWEVLDRQLRAPETTFLIPPEPRARGAATELLQRQQIEIGILNAPRALRAAPVLGGERAEKRFPAGTLVVSTRQPLGAIVRTLFEKTPTIDPTFIEAQRERVEADEPDEFYDITAWSLPVAFALPTWSIEGGVPAGAVSAWSDPPAPAAPAPAAFGWIVDGLDPEIYRLAGELLRRGINFSVVDAELEHGGRTFARGSILVQRHNNGDGIHDRLVEVSQGIAAHLVGVDSGWSGGLALGSRRIAHVRDPKIAIVGGAGTAPTSFGALWHTFDRITPIPHTVLSLDRLGAADLSKFRVLILPDGGGYGEALQERAAGRLRTWVEQGNTLIAIRRAARALRAEEVAISKTRLWEPPEEKREEGEPPPPTRRYHDYSVPGAAFRTTMSSRSFLTFGLDSAPPVLVDGSDVLLPVAYAVDNVITIAKNDPLLAGFAWPQSIERLKGSAWLVVEPLGRGRVITFAGDPFFRSFWHGTLPLLLNAALYSPSM
ncbi:MAG TPA: M14 family metallopeptidase, partial [Thermoanaerobaculia bacterium]|nr:M14 family metallopeptidase [Thermoanaerobaculia bacterium]